MNLDAADASVLVTEASSCPCPRAGPIVELRVNGTLVLTASPGFAIGVARYLRGSPSMARYLARYPWHVG